MTDAEMILELHDVDVLRDELADAGHDRPHPQAPDRRHRPPLAPPLRAGPRPLRPGGGGRPRPGLSGLLHHPAHPRRSVGRRPAHHLRVLRPDPLLAVAGPGRASLGGRGLRAYALGEDRRVRARPGPRGATGEEWLDSHEEITSGAGAAARRAADSRLHDPEGAAAKRVRRDDADLARKIRVRREERRSPFFSGDQSSCREGTSASWPFL